MKTHLNNQEAINSAIKELANIKPNGEYSVEIKKLSKKRSVLQNRAVHKYFGMVAEELNDNNLTVQTVLSEAIERHWDVETVKSQLWKPLQFALFGDAKTSEMNTKAYDKVYFYLSHFLADKFGIDVAFPSKDK